MKGYLSKPFEMMFDLPPVDNRWGIPIITDTENIEVNEVIGFNYAKAASEKSYEKTVHFFLADKEFNVVWTHPDKYVEKLKKYNAVFSPDFSTYRNHPFALQLYNTLRNRFVGYYWQNNGINVIPTVGWGDEESFAFCFDGVQRGSAVAISTRGVASNLAAMELFEKGYSEMLRRVNPRKVYVYGARERIENRMKFDDRVHWLPYEHESLHF